MRNRVLGVIQAILMLAFMVDCLVLLAGGRSYDLDGGLSLIVLLALTGIVRHFRTNRDNVFYFD